jgi:hypothetical protein
MKMSNEKSNLPANISNMATGLVASVQTVAAGGGAQFMKMSKAGEFIYGAEDIEVEDGSTWAVNPMGLQHGWIAWGDKTHGTAGKMLGEKMGPAAQPIFPESDLDAVEGSWSQAIAIPFRCMDGEDEGIQALYKANSFGGRKAYGALLEKIVGRITANEEAYVPLVRLANTSYKHDEYGKIYNPDFIITDWVTMAGIPTEEPEETVDDGTEAVAPEVEEKPKRSRKGVETKQVEEPVVEEEAEDAVIVEEATEAPRRRRRKAS